MEKQNTDEYLLQIPLWTKQKNSFKVIELFLEELGNPHQQFPIIHVAGTNGKGSVCAFLTSMLKEAGFQTGTFTSPHLVDIRERIMLNGEMVDQALFQESFHKVHAVTDRMMQKGYFHPTFFEFIFLMSMVVFGLKRVDYVILETGLGGRLDATNVIKNPLACIITSISLDHTEYLGNTIEKIAQEKAGIIKKGVPVIYDCNEKAVIPVIEQKAQEQQAPCYAMGKKSILCSESRLGGWKIDAETRDEKVISLQVPFQGNYQMMNALLAYQTLELLKLPNMTKEMMTDGIRKTKWPGRMEQVLPGIYLDGAHNLGGIEAFIDTVRQIEKQTKKNISLVYASVADKEYEKMIHRICEEIPLSYVAVVQICNHRGASSHSLAVRFRSETECQVSDFSTVDEAITDVLAKKQPEDLVFCVGSLYLIGEIKAVLRRFYYD